MYLKLNNYKNNILTKLFSFLIIFMLIFSSCNLQEKSYAHKTAYLVCMLDTYNMTIQVTSGIDKDGYFDNEAGHLEYLLGDFSESTWNSVNSLPEGLKKGELNTPEDSSHGMKWSWPPKGWQRDGDSAKELNFADSFIEKTGNATGNLVSSVWSFFSGKSQRIQNDVTGQEIERSVLVGTTLVNGFNDAMAFAYKDKEKPKTPEEFFERARALVSGSVEGCTFDYPSVSSGSDLAGSKNAMATVKITKEINGKSVTQEFPCVMDKGYASGLLSSKPFPGVDTELYNGCDELIGWGDIVYQAEYIYVGQGVTMANSYDMLKTNVVETFLIEMGNNLIYGIQSALGLYSTEELIFSEGVRGSSAWMFGVMPASWFHTVQKLHIAMLSIAFSILIFAFIKTIFEENLSSLNANPTQRVAVLDNIKNIAITFFLLTCTFPLISFVIQVSGLFTKLFSSYVPQGFLSGSMGQGGLLSTLVIMFAFLFINIYLNILYIVRSIMIAMLIVTAPLFIVAYAFGGKWKLYFNQWWKELLSNICLQPVHAMTIGSLALMSTNARGIERFVFTISILFVTEFYRNLLLQGGAGATIMGSKGAFNTMKGLGAAGLAAGGSIAGGVLAKGGEGVDSLHAKINGKGSSSGGDSKGTQVKIKSSETYKTDSALDKTNSPNELKQAIDKRNGTSTAQTSTATTVDSGDNGSTSSSDTSDTTSNDTTTSSVSTPDGSDTGSSSTGSSFVSKAKTVARVGFNGAYNVGKAAGKVGSVGVNATKMVAGAGMMLSGTDDMMASRMISSGAQGLTIKPHNFDQNQQSNPLNNPVISEPTQSVPQSVPSEITPAPAPIITDAGDVSFSSSYNSSFNEQSSKMTQKESTPFVFTGIPEQTQEVTQEQTQDVG